MNASYTAEQKDEFLTLVEETIRHVTRAELKRLIGLAENDKLNAPAEDIKTLCDEVIALINRVGKFRFDDWGVTDGELLTRAKEQKLQ